MLALRNIWRELGRLLPFGRAAAPRLTVIPKLVVPVGREAIAVADRPADIAALRGGTMSRAGLCVMIVNSGVEPVTVRALRWRSACPGASAIPASSCAIPCCTTPSRGRAGCAPARRWSPISPAISPATTFCRQCGGPLPPVLTGRHGPVQARRFPGTCGRNGAVLLGPPRLDILLAPLCRLVLPACRRLARLYPRVLLAAVALFGYRHNRGVDDLAAHRQNSPDPSGSHRTSRIRPRSRQLALTVRGTATPSWRREPGPLDPTPGCRCGRGGGASRRRPSPTR